MRHESANLDLLRTVAVSLVVGSHLVLLVTPAREAYLPSIRVIGRLGVMIFFVHTALVLSMSLQRQPGAAAFLVRRVFRIYPLAMAIVLLMAALVWVGGRPIEPAQLFANLLLVQNITGHVSTPDPLWSLPYEMQMYLLLPALFLLARSPRGAATIAMIWGASILVASAIPLAIYLPCFVPGVLAFSLSRHCRRVLNPVWMFAVVAVAIVGIPAMVAAGVPELPACYCLCLAMGLVIPHCREIQSSTLATFGKVVATYSYGIYLTHVFSTVLAFPPGKAGPVQWAVFAVLLPSFAWLAYHAVEAPGIRLGVRLASALEKEKHPRPVRVEGA